MNLGGTSNTSSTVCSWNWLMLSFSQFWLPSPLLNTNNHAKKQRQEIEACCLILKLSMKGSPPPPHQAFCHNKSITNDTVASWLLFMIYPLFWTSAAQLYKVIIYTLYRRVPTKNRPPFWWAYIPWLQKKIFLIFTVIFIESEEILQ